MYISMERKKQKQKQKSYGKGNRYEENCIGNNHIQPQIKKNINPNFAKQKSYYIKDGFLQQ